ncbi:MAG: DPP IV N-terminal domain-containing protein [Actinomycetota bacterium]|nr:DPP IV N-terminal domain-containing protein [Actinomycetota bacterium]
MTDDLRDIFEREMKAAPPPTLDAVAAIRKGKKRRLMVNGSLGLMFIALAVAAVSGGATLLSSDHRRRLPPAERGPTLSSTRPILVAGQLQAGTEAGRDNTIYALDESGRAELVLDASPIGFEAEPAWSPDRSMIAFSMNVKEGDPDTLNPNMELFIATDSRVAEGGTVTRTTHSEKTDTSPAWSPDGKRIAFVSDRSGNGDIYIFDIDSRSLQQVTTNPGPDAFPAWSPDGTELLFASNRKATVDLYAVDLQSGEERQITNGDEVEGWPSWSPDGRTIVFSRSFSRSVYLLEEGAHGPREIEVVSTSSESPEAGGDGDSYRGPRVGDVVWSPAGDQLAVVVLDEELGRAAGRVLIVDLDGTRAAQSPVFEMLRGIAWKP